MMQPALIGQFIIASARRVADAEAHLVIPNLNTYRVIPDTDKSILPGKNCFAVGTRASPPVLVTTFLLPFGSTTVSKRF